jgi:para-aminobenzoate synthetase/4-amino-4-deoxychorismate lyase
MQVIWDGAGGRRVFQRPLDVIRADSPAEVPAALKAVEAALRQGNHIAGWLGYELGYALEPRLTGRAPAGPLLRLGIFQAPESRVPGPAGRAYAGPLALEWDEAAYTSRFDKVKAYIAAGDIYQANLSCRAHFRFLGDPLALYERLRTDSQAAHCAFADDGERQVLSLSPELFFDLAADGPITVRPMKGTLARHGDDAAERAQLAASAKDRAENLMIVDLIRNDLSRIAEPGSVAVSDLFKIETYPTLHTMVSTVTARKRAGIGAADILRALFPCGSITGAPKIRAMEILHGLESSPRGAYCGALGWFAPDGSARFNVAIRTVTISRGRGELGIGGGVVQDSDSAGEYAECRLKARFFEQNRRPLELIETLRHGEPGIAEGPVDLSPRRSGFVRLEAHLARMQNSAVALGLSFDAAAARAALDQAVAGRSGSLRVRLTLDEQGAHLATAHDLAPIFNQEGSPHWTFRLAAQRTDSGDALLRHKTSWREPYDQPHPDCDEVVFCNQRGELTEGARSNLFVRRGDMLLTPPLAAGLLPGVLRAELIEQGRAKEAVLTPDDFDGEVYFGNSLRGLIRGLRL